MTAFALAHPWLFAILVGVSVFAVDDMVSHVCRIWWRK